MIIDGLMGAMIHELACEVVLEGAEPIQRKLDGRFDWSFLRDEVRG
jgi:hypothetical protein